MSSSNHSNVWQSWKTAIGLIFSLKVTLKYMIDNLNDSIFEHDSISAISIGNHMLVLYDLSKVADKHLKKMWKIMFLIKTSMDDTDKEDILYIGQQYNEVFVWYIRNHHNEDMVSEFESVLRFIDFDVKYFYHVLLENNDLRVSCT